MGTKNNNLQRKEATPQYKSLPFFNALIPQELSIDWYGDSAIFQLNYIHLMLNRQ